ncbi:hypothetical protein ACQ4PT_042827 [Festuca glaucescens]
MEIQKLRCRVNFAALRFTPEIEELGRRVVRILRQNGSFLVLHLRYEMDMLAFSRCTHGCSPEEAEELTRMRYYIPSRIFSRCMERESDRLQCEEERRPLPINTGRDCNGIKGTRHRSQLSNIYCFW